MVVQELEDVLYVLGLQIDARDVAKKFDGPVFYYGVSIKVTIFHWILLENQDGYQNYETWVLCRTDQISIFPMICFSKFGRD